MAKIYKRRARAKVPRVVGEDGQEKVKRGKIIRHEEIHVQRPIVRVLWQIEAWTRQLTFFHVPNQLLRTSKLKKIFHGLGIRPGVSDLPILLPGGRTIWLELKFKGGEMSEKQDKFADRARALGHIVATIEAADSMDAVKQLYALLAEHGLTDFRLR